MTQWLKVSTAVTVMMGPFIDDTDGKTPEIALDITEQEVLLSKNGGAFTLKSDTTHGVHDASHNGWYTIPLNTTDTNTLGCLDIAINMAGALPVWKSYMVVTANTWDTFFGADKLTVDVEEIGANIITAAAINDGAIDAATFAAGAINAAAIADAAIDNATFAADVGSTAYATNIIALAVRKVLDILNLDHLLAVVTAAADMTTEVIDNSILSRVLGNGDTSTFVPSTDGLHAAGVDLDDLHTDVADLHTDVGTALTNIADLHTDLADVHTDVAAIGAGMGAVTFTYTLSNSVDGTPIADADIWITSDAAGTNVLASGQTNQLGQVTFYLDAGTVYVWRQKSGWNFANPDTEVVA